MKILFIAILLLQLFFQKSCYMEKEYIVFEGILIELPHEAPRCGDIKVAVGYSFIVVRNIRGRSLKGTVVVLIPCPDFKSKDFFISNGRYHIESMVDSEESGSHTIFNQYSNVSTVLWCDKIEPVK